MTDTLPLSIQPVISYPKEAEVGKTYLMEVDLQMPESGFEWQYEEEEYLIYCMVNAGNLFTVTSVGEPAIVLHRFGGTYGNAKFLLEADLEQKGGSISIVFVNQWGFTIRTVSCAVNITTINLSTISPDASVNLRNEYLSTPEDIENEDVFESENQRETSTNEEQSFVTDLPTSNDNQSNSLIEKVSPVVLIILTGWGYREDIDGNAIAAANTPVIDSLWSAYPRTLLQASGKGVGLPKGQMGNNEVGYLNIGAGRIVRQELVRISDAVDDGSLLVNSTLVGVCEKVKANKGKLHLIGLCSDGGVHSHIDHLLGLIDFAKVRGIQDVCIHAITDGRDVLPQSGINFINLLQAHIDKIGTGKIVTISGRYFMMDRDKHWDRVQKAYEILTNDQITTELTSAVDVLAAAYQEKITDEFLPPTRIAHGVIAAGDGVICFNFRPDRFREITQAFVSEEFTGFERERIEPLTYATFTQYDSSLSLPVAFSPQNMTNLLGPVVSQNGLKQFRIAETETYGNVTYFFDCGLEEANEGEDRVLINSPRVSTYNQKPEMAAYEVTRIASEAISKHIYSLIVISYANADLVGHTGDFEATVKAIEHLDLCLGKLLASINSTHGTALITASHGKAEYMLDENGNAWTAHTTYPVPFILVEGKGRKVYDHAGEVKLRTTGGRLADIAPTILEILKIPQPLEMSGVSLIDHQNGDLPNSVNKCFQQIESYLKAKEWKNADRVTYQLILSAVGKEIGQYLSEDNLRNFPCDELLALDQLWVKYSNGLYGFSVQKQIYIECGGKLDFSYPSSKTWNKFCNRVAWMDRGKYVFYSDVFMSKFLSVKGHLPLISDYEGGQWKVELFLFSRLATCGI